MVSVSDNSATDILLHALGRDKVEAVLPVVGIKEPAGMRPFLSTLEMFKLKGVDGGALGDQRLELDEKRRRKLLAAQAVPAQIVAIQAGPVHANKPNKPEQRRVGRAGYARVDSSRACHTQNK